MLLQNPIKTPAFCRKRKSPEVSAKSSPASTPTGDDGSVIKRRRSDKPNQPLEVIESTSSSSMQIRPNPLIVLTLKEMHEIVRMFTSSPPGCVDWTLISSQVTNARISPLDIEYVANEFIPHIHYRPSIGMVVMERNSKGHSDYQRHRQTVKRMKQGLPYMLEKFKRDMAKL